MQWGFSHVGLEYALQGHFKKLVNAKMMTVSEAETAGSAIKTFLMAHDTGLLRLDPVRQMARNFNSLPVARPQSQPQPAG